MIEEFYFLVSCTQSAVVFVCATKAPRFVMSFGIPVGIVGGGNFHPIARGVVVKADS